MISYIFRLCSKNLYIFIRIFLHNVFQKLGNNCCQWSDVCAKSISMFIRGKPIRYGYKIWALASSKGYMYQVEPYCGAMTNLETTGKGQGYDVVMGLLNKADVPAGKRIFFDNLFTSLDLLDELSSMKIGGCGTMRENRLGNAPINNKKAFEKLSKGTTEHMSNGMIRQLLCARTLYHQNMCIMKRQGT